LSRRNVLRGLVLLALPLCLLLFWGQGTRGAAESVVGSRALPATQVAALAPAFPAAPAPPEAGLLTAGERDPQTAEQASRPDGVGTSSVTGVFISGPASGTAHMEYAFTATASITPTTPTHQVTYVWEATGQSPITNTTDLTDTASFTWDIAGTHTITVTASGGGGSAVATHAIVIGAPPTPTTTPSITPSPTSTPSPTPLPAPDISDVEPDWFVNTQPNQITILGSAFQSGAVVRAKTYGLLSSEWINDTVLTALVPAGLAKGRYDVMVTNPDGQSDTRKNAFEVAAPTRTPTITPEPTSTGIPTSTPEPTPTPFMRPLLSITSSSTNPSSVAPD
jgi:hypothetical protein